MNMTKSLPAILSIGPGDQAQTNWRRRILIIAISLVVIDILHYSTSPSISQLHAVYRYFYFPPIVYAALRFGLWGGLISTIAASLIFIPHIIMRWQDYPIDTLNDLLVVVVLFGVAVITGRIADGMSEAQAKQSAIAEDLAISYHKLESQGAELRRAERLISLGTLAGGLAHQIRNPVSIIRASSQLLDSTSDTDDGEIAKVIQDEADRIEQLVGRLLNYAGEQTIERSATDIVHLFTSVQQRVRVAAEPLGIEVVTYCDKEVNRWFLDGEQIEQALVNLCINAIQAIDQANSSQQAADLEFEIQLRAQHIGDTETKLQLLVIDNGPGIPKHVQPHIFDPFFSTKDTGTGLGLSVVQRIVEDHGGSIHLNSTDRSGLTTFAVQLPDEPHFSSTRPDSLR